MTPNPQHVIGFIGYPAAGKTTTASLVEDAFDAEAVAIGDVVRAHLEDQWGYEPDGPEIRDWVTETLQEDDEAVIRRVVEQLQSRDLPPILVIDGVRTPADVRVLRREFDAFTLTFLDVPDEVRLERIRDRGRDDEAAFSMEDLHERDADEEAWGLGDLVENEVYDYRIEAYGNDYEERLETLVQSLQNGDVSAP